MSEIQIDKELDCRGMSCPLPVLKTKKAVSDMTAGQVLKMTCTDQGSKKDMPSWSERTGNPILSSEEKEGEFTFWIKKA